MFINKIKTQALALFAMFCLGTSCVSDLDDVKLNPNQEFPSNVFKNAESYNQFLGKLYGGFALTGQKGPTGDGDVHGIDEGFSSYVRGYWKLQELTTEEAVTNWGDDGIQDLHSHSWAASNPIINGIYQRIFNQIAFCNEFLRQSVDSKLSERGITDKVVQQYRAEARFLRALCYYHAMDLFGNVPFATEADPVGSFNPPQIKRADLFKFIEKELKEIIAGEDLLSNSATAVNYGRADKRSANALLAKLYLNAEVYTGTAKWNEASQAALTVIETLNAGFNDNYANLFKADNDHAKGILFPVRFNGVETQTWGGTTFLIAASIGGKMDPADYGSDQKWGGLRTTSALVNKFSAGDNRAIFYTNGQSLEINNISEFTEGYAVPKFVNKKSNGENGTHKTFADTDFPLCRLADMYLTYAEAAVNGAGNKAKAVQLINKLRERAYGNANHGILVSDLTNDLILDERARELYWEGYRRTDLIRHNKFTGGDYVWPWKGGVKAGKPTSDYMKLFPIPTSDLGANPNLVQNPGY
ncbi:MAG: RagB/SusD family nutrient uptake outer membrane protein [Cytophagales bacterium]|nr:RagB/SusD family nutrient uptake outer membrane protein [Cytophagales bacterium]